MKTPIIKLMITALFVTAVATMAFATGERPVSNDKGLDVVTQATNLFIPPPDDEETETAEAVGDRSLAPRVNVMPGDRNGSYAYSWPNKSLIIWGNVHNGVPPYTYVWEFGDGTPNASGTVSNPEYINETHAYTNLGRYTATLTVTDNNGASNSDQVTIRVYTQNLTTEVNRAIEDGLRWLYLNQQSSGGWSSYQSYYAGPTSMALIAFEDNGHLPINNIDDDIYAEYVQEGLNYLLTTLYATGIGAQGAGNPEDIACGNDDANNIAIGVNSNRSGYETGMALMAFIAAGPLGSGADSLLTSPSLPANIGNRYYYDICVDMVDWLAWAQTEPNRGYWRGGWRYGPNYSSSDNSNSQWPAIGLEAAETQWGICAPQWVKDELLIWLNNSQRSGGFYDGSFWYTTGWVSWGGPTGVTGSGLCALFYADVPVGDPRVDRTICYLLRHWGVWSNWQNYYNNYAVSKAFRIGVPEAIEVAGCADTTLNWYDDHYAPAYVASQGANGSWGHQGSQHNWGQSLRTAWAVLILSPIFLGPVAVADVPATSPPCADIDVDGSGSYHLNAGNFREIRRWLWDFDKSDGYDWDNPDDSGEFVTMPGIILPEGVTADTLTIALKVYDNEMDFGGDSANSDIDEHVIIINLDNHCPIADPGGPYYGMVGDTIVFDGTASYDPDTTACGGVVDSIVSWAWDLDGDGQFDDCFDPVCYGVWDSPYSGEVGLIVFDSYGCSSDSNDYIEIGVCTNDLYVTDADIEFSDPTPDMGDTITITATIHLEIDWDNCYDTISGDSCYPVDSAEVRFYDGNPGLGGAQIGAPQWVYDLYEGVGYPASVDFVVPTEEEDTIFVVVDPTTSSLPGGDICEYDEDNNMASAYLLTCESVSSAFLPIQVYAFMAWAVEPMTGKVYLTDFPDGYLPSDVEFGSVEVNNAITPSSISVSTEVPLWVGQEVLVLEFSLRDFILGYLPVWDQTWVTWHVKGIFTDQTEFDYCDELWFFGHLSGDVDNSGNVDVSDITYLVDFLFGGGPAPRILEQADLDHSGVVDISDLAALVEILF